MMTRDRDIRYTLGRCELFIENQSLGGCTAKIIVTEEVLDYYQRYGRVETRDALTLSSTAYAEVVIEDGERARAIHVANDLLDFRLESESPDRGMNRFEGKVRLVNWEFRVMDSVLGNYYGDCSPAIWARFEFVRSGDYDNSYFVVDMVDENETEEIRRLRRWRPPKGVRRIRLK